MSAQTDAGLLVEPSPSLRSSDRRRWWILCLLGLAQLMVVLDLTVVNIALPSAQQALGFSNGDRQWVVTAYSLAFGGLLLVGGRLSDLLGRKRMFLIGLVGFAAASALGGLSTGFPMLVAARGLQGAFGAILAPATLSLMTTTFSDPAERSKAFGIYGAIAGGGGAVGLLLGGALTQYLDWRACLYVNDILAVIAVLAAIVLLPRQASRRGGPRLDLPGAITSVAGLVALVYGFSEAEQQSWTSPITLGLLTAAVVLLALFVWIESRVEHPLLPLRVIADRNRGGAYLTVGLTGIGMFGVFLFLTYYLQDMLRYSPVTTGLAFLPMVGLLMAAATISGTVLLPRIGPRPLVGVGLLIGAGGLVLLTQLSLGTTYAGGVLPGLLIFGLGLGLVFGPAMNIATYGAAAADAGVASAMVNTTQQIGASIGTALLNTIALNAAATWATGKPHTPLLAAQATVHGDTVAFWVVVGIFAVGAVLCGLVLRPGRFALSEQAVPALG